MYRLFVPILIFCAACRPTTDDATVAPGPTTDNFIEQAIALDVEFGRALPTLEAAEDHALELAQLSRAASESVAGRDHPHGARRLATIADLVRDELLTCRSPLWELRQPPLSADAHTGAWLNAHQRSIRRGFADGWVTDRARVDAALNELETQLARVSSRDAELYVGPPLRRHREFLHRELRDRARVVPGLSGLPTGSQCFASRARLMAGGVFDAETTRRAAVGVLRRPQLLSPAELRHPALRTPHAANVWRPTPAVARGMHLLRSIRNDRRGPAVLSLIAAGALVDLAIHGGVGTVAEVQRRTPWIPVDVFDEVVTQSVGKPLRWLSMFEGQRVLEELRGEAPAAMFDDRVQTIGPIEPDILALEL